MENSSQQRIEELVAEEIAIVGYDPAWPSWFEQEAKFLRSCIPTELIGRIEHFGSTAVPGLSAKPIIDLLVEVSSLDEMRRTIVPLLEAQGYEYFWRPAIEDKPPYYAWFIRRDANGQRTHHIHMVEADSELWDRLFFRDYLRRHADEARRYEELKRGLARQFPHDRVSYTKEKTRYIVSVTDKARKFFSASPSGKP